VADTGRERGATPSEPADDLWPEFLDKLTRLSPMERDYVGLLADGFADGWLQAETVGASWFKAWPIERRMRFLWRRQRRHRRRASR
jgi:hypothetical protein